MGVKVIDPIEKVKNEVEVSFEENIDGYYNSIISDLEKYTDRLRSIADTNYKIIGLFLGRYFIGVDQRIFNKYSKKILKKDLSDVKETYDLKAFNDKLDIYMGEDGLFIMVLNNEFEHDTDYMYNKNLEYIPNF